MSMREMALTKEEKMRTDDDCCPKGEETDRKGKRDDNDGGYLPAYDGSGRLLVTSVVVEVEDE